MKKALVLASVASCLALTSIASAQWSDNFDSYPSNANINGLGGWQGWGGVAAQSPNTSTAQALSAPNSILVTGNGDTGGPGYSDNVHQYSGYTSGQWRYIANVFIPANYTGNEYFILMNTYADPTGPFNWSVELLMNGTTGQISDDYQTGVGGTIRTGAPVSFVRGAWSQIQVDFDLTADTVSQYYNGTLVASGPWRTTSTSALNLAAVDLYSGSGNGIYFDNLSLTQIPEPGTLSLLALGAVAALRRRRAK